MQNPRKSASTGATSRAAQQVPSNARSGGRSSTLRRAGSLLSADTPSTPPALAAGSSSLFNTTSPSGLNSSGSTAGLAAEAAVSNQLLSSQLAALAGTAEVPPRTPPEEEGAGHAGLTPASLKHLKRQNGKLTEDKERLTGELGRNAILIQELRDRIAELEALLREKEIREAKFEEELREEREHKEAERQRADDAEKLNVRLEESLAAKEAENAKLRLDLEDQLLLTKEVCEAAERSTGEARATEHSAEEIARLKEQVKKLSQEKAELQKDRERQEREHAELIARTGFAMAAAEKAMAMHASHMTRLEQLRVAKLADAIQHKVELHISVPRVTLSYNNAPPLQISTASVFGDDRIKAFLEHEVFCHFEPLWVTLDALDQAPDGTCKKAYSTRMLDRLTEAVKGFVEKSQLQDGEGGLTPSIREGIEPRTGGGLAPSLNKTTGAPAPSLAGLNNTAKELGLRSSPSKDGGAITREALDDAFPSVAERCRATSSSGRGGGKNGGPSPRGGSVPSPRSGGIAGSGGGIAGRSAAHSAGNEGIGAVGAAGSSPAATRGGGGGSGSAEDLAEGDRARLLALLRSGDDRGLDSKLKELMQSRG